MEARTRAARGPGGPPGFAGRKGPDLTTGPIGSALILFALPVLGSNILQSLNGSANAIWVSHVLGEAALQFDAGWRRQELSLLDLEVEFVRKSTRVCKFRGRASVDGQTTCEAEFTAMIADSPES